MSFFGDLRSVVLLRRIDKNLLRLAIAAERISATLERGDKDPGLVFRSYENDATGEAGVYPMRDDILSEIFEREKRLSRELTEAEVADLFSGKREDVVGD